MLCDLSAVIGVSSCTALAGHFQMLPDTWCRAEATDVANAVMDGADAFLLGAETLRGFHPVLTIATILSIARQAEAVFDHTHHFDHLMTVGLLPPNRSLLS